MRKIVIATALSSGLLLSACATSGGLPGPGPSPSPGPDINISSIIQATKLACGFVPTAQTVAALVNVTGVTAVLDIANEICSVVQRVSARRGSVPRLHGVVIHGRFVRH